MLGDPEDGELDATVRGASLGRGVRCRGASRTEGANLEAPFVDARGEQRPHHGHRAQSRQLEIRRCRAGIVSVPVDGQARDLWVSSQIVRHELQNPLASALLSGTFADGDAIAVTVKGDRLTFTRR